MNENTRPSRVVTADYLATRALLADELARQGVVRMDDLHAPPATDAEGREAAALAAELARPRLIVPGPSLLDIELEVNRSLQQSSARRALDAELALRPREVVAIALLGALMLLGGLVAFALACTATAGV